MFAIFLPPLVAVIFGVVGLGAGIAVHSVLLAATGALCLVIGGARWLRKRSQGAA